MYSECLAWFQLLWFSTRCHGSDDPPKCGVLIIFFKFKKKKTTNNWNEIKGSKTIQKGYQNTQSNFRHFLIWSGSRMTKKCAEFRGIESGGKVIQLYVGLLRSYLKIKRKPKSLKVMWLVYKVQYSICPFSCWTAFYASQCINLLNTVVFSVLGFLLIFSYFMFLHSIPAYLIIRIILLVCLFPVWLGELKVLDDFQWNLNPKLLMCLWKCYLTFPGPLILNRSQLMDSLSHSWKPSFTFLSAALYGRKLRGNYKKKNPFQA